jgi:uncharacterized protein YkwD
MSSMLAVSRRIRFTIAGAVVAAGLVAPAQALADCANANANPHDVSLAASKTATVCLLNEIRRDKGLRAFHRNGRLSKASQRHTNSMASGRYFAHGDFVGRIKSAGYLRGVGSWTVGENIAWGSYDYASPKMIVRGWMNSPPHRRNILSGKFREIGIGITRGSPMKGAERGALYATDFGTRY